MYAAIALIPFGLIRIVYFRIIDKVGYQRAQKFAPFAKGKQIYYGFYQICQLFLLVIPLAERIYLYSSIDFLAAVLYLAGLIIIALAIHAFSQSDKDGLSQSGIYRYSRHPMYVGYFFFYLGLGLWMRSIPYLITLVLFQLLTHQMVLAEEAWCLKEFGSAYQNYMKKTPRYL